MEMTNAEIISISLGGLSITIATLPLVILYMKKRIVAKKNLLALFNVLLFLCEDLMNDYELYRSVNKDKSFLKKQIIRSVQNNINDIKKYFDKIDLVFNDNRHYSLDIFTLTLSLEDFITFLDKPLSEKDWLNLREQTVNRICSSVMLLMTGKTLERAMAENKMPSKNIRKTIIPKYLIRLIPIMKDKELLAKVSIKAKKSIDDAYPNIEKKYRNCVFKE